MPVRVRFAPSPTGIPHVGSVRTALFNWLYARHTDGVFILRIEDTDRSRYDPRALEAIFGSLRWLGLDWDEGPEAGGDYGPYVQSERLEHYERYARQLIEQGNAYECFCSTERLAEIRAERQRRKQPPRYDRHCRDLTAAEREERRAAGDEAVVRFRTPDEGTTSFDDIVRGHVEFETATIDDFVVRKSDGFPTAHLAHVVDDHLMEISHVLRGDEWVSSTPRQILLYQALGWEPPQFAHMSVILGPDKAKLSKRHGALSALEYRDQGYLPEAMLNFLGLIGWSLDDKTVLISREQFIEHFSLERMGKNPAAFDLERLTWMNGAYLRELPEERLTELFAERLESDLPDAAPRPIDRETVRRLVPLVRERIKRLDELAELVTSFFSDEMSYTADDLLGKQFKEDSSGAAAAFRAAAQRAEALSAWEHPAIEEAMRGLADELELKAGALFMLLRVAVTGRAISPPLFESMELLGKERCLKRLQAALTVLTK
ncbi:MAG: glutamate--tRNA ligase [Chloroflexi bacterium]|nr:glutamate--tRNA ligase [Chloroflexota bacterium]